MCEIFGAAFAPDSTTGKIWRFTYYLVLLAVFGVGVYLAIASGSFS